MENAGNYTANCIRALRQRAGIKQDVIAKFLGVKRSTYSHYETGRLHPSAEKLALLASYYQVSVDSLCGRLTLADPVAEGRGGKQSRPQAVTPDDLTLISAYHHLTGREQMAVWRMVTEMAEG